MASGETFQRIYEIVRQIPKGYVASYGYVAKKSATIPRVVGYALNKNPEPGIIPCHRVVFKDGSLTKGFAFGGQQVQRKLLENEGVSVDNNNIVNKESILKNE